MSNGLEDFWKRLKNWFTVLSGLKYFRSTRTSLHTNTGRKQVSPTPLSVTRISQDKFHQVRYDRIKRHVSFAKEFFLEFPWQAVTPYLEHCILCSKLCATGWLQTIYDEISTEALPVRISKIIVILLSNLCGGLTGAIRS